MRRMGTLGLLAAALGLAGCDVAQEIKNTAVDQSRRVVIDSVDDVGDSARGSLVQQGDEVRKGVSNRIRSDGGAKHDDEFAEPDDGQ